MWAFVTTQDRQPMQEENKSFSLDAREPTIRCIFRSTAKMITYIH